MTTSRITWYLQWDSLSVPRFYFSFCSSFQSLEWKWVWIYTIALSEVLEYHRANGALVIMTYIGDSRTLLVLSTFYCVFHLFHFMRALITRWYAFNISYVLFIRLKMCAWYCWAFYKGGPHRHAQTHTRIHPHTILKVYKRDYE